MSYPTINRHYPNAQTLSEDPLVCVIEDFIEADLCNHLIALATPHMVRATVAQNGIREKSDVRTNQVTFLRHSRDKRVQALVARVSELIGMPASHAESLQMIYYQQGQQYEPHYDTFNADDPGQRVFLGKSGQRLVTALMYLCDVDAGGETKFPNLDVEVQPKAGRMIVFHSCEEGGNFPHENALHGGMPVLEGEKWAANLWFREKPFVG